MAECLAALRIRPFLFCVEISFRRISDVTKPALAIFTGQRFGRLTVTEPAGSDKIRNALWRCLCDCGNAKVATASNLFSGKTKSCGCLRDELRVTQGKANRTHGKTGARVYRIWLHIKDRCQNPKHVHFASYGGRGVGLCESWSSFENFFADMGEPPSKASIERIDNDKGYEPDNCRWATPAEQSRNKRNNVLLTHDGRTLCLTDWAEVVSMPRPTLAARIRAGWSADRALTAPVNLTLSSTRWRQA